MNSWLRLAHGALAITWLAGCGPESAPEPTTSAVVPHEPASNLVLICIDTVSAPNFFSPIIDDELNPWLSSAQQYLDASSAAPWTIPSVASTLTGLYPVQHRAGSFDTDIANLDVDLPSALSGGAETLAERLQQAGWDTAAFSAHPWFAADFGFDQGFDQLHLRKGWPKVTARFGEWLDARPGQNPFFGYLHFMEAHDWHTKPRAELEQRLAGLEPEALEGLRADASAAACADPNDDMCLRNMVYNLAIRELRGALAAILTDLEGRGLLNDTLVMVYSDHGEEFWQHREQHENRGDPRGFHGYGHGHSLYQEMINVPLVAWHPHAPGARHDTPVSLVDVFPSALSWLGAPPAGPDYPGQRLPLGPMQPDARPVTPLFASGIAYGSEAVATRLGREKSVLYLASQAFEHFDLSSDPTEHQPLENDGRTMQTDVQVGDYLELGSASIAYRPELNADQLEQLKSIGYLQGVDETATGRTTGEPESPEAEDEP